MHDDKARVLFFASLFEIIILLFKTNLKTNRVLTNNLQSKNQNKITI